MIVFEVEAGVVHLRQTFIRVPQQSTPIPAGTVGQAVEDKACSMPNCKLGERAIILVERRLRLRIAEQMKGREFFKFEPSFVHQPSFGATVGQE